MPCPRSWSWIPPYKVNRRGHREGAQGNRREGAWAAIRNEGAKGEKRSRKELFKLFPIFKSKKQP